MDLAENILYESNWSLKAQKLLSFVLNFNLYKYFDTKKKVNTKKVLFKIIYPSRNPAFWQVTRCLLHGNTHGGKHSAFKFQKKKDQVTETSECQHSQNGKDIHDCYSTIRKDRNYELFVGTRERAASASCIQEKPQHDAPMCTKRSRSEKEELSLLLAHLGSYYSPVNDSFDQAASLGSERWDENPSIVDSSHDCITLDKPTSKVPLKKTT